MARYYKTVTVSGVANEEALETLITSTIVEPVHVLKIYPYETTSTRQGDAMIRLYIEREKIAEFPIYMFQMSLDNKAYVNVPTIELDHDIPEGQSLIAGVVSGSTASDITFIIEYEIRT